MSVKRKGPLPGFRALPSKRSVPRIRKPVNENTGSGMSNARQVKPESMFAWTGVIAASLADIPAGCICDWIYHKGVLEIKYVNGLCLIRHTA